MDHLSSSELVKNEDSSKLEDFGRSFVHSALENPVNGLRQVCNQTGLLNLPEFKIVNDSKPTIASDAGAIAGSVASFSLLAAGGNRLMGGLGGEGIGGSVLRAGITGAVFDGVLKPSAENSPNFWADRGKSALIGAGTFAGMAAGSAGLDKTGLFAVPEARSLQGSIAYGALSGIAGGLAHAQAEALVNDGHLFASPKAYLSDSLSYSAFGAGFGAVGYGAEKMSAYMNNRVIELKSEDTSVRMKLDRSGEVAQVETILPSVNTPGAEVRVTNSKMTDGNWSSSAKARFEGDRGFWMDANSYSVSQVNRLPSGELRLLDTEGNVRAFSESGEYGKYLLGQKLLGEKFDYKDVYGNTTIVNNSQLNKFDEQGKLIEFKDWNTKSLNYFRYDRNGDLSHFSTWREGGKSVDLSKLNGEWRGSLSTVIGVSESGVNSSSTSGADMFKWKGEIKPIGTNTFQLSPENGKPFNFKSGDATTALENALRTP